MKKRKIQVAVVLFIAAVTLLSSSFGRQVDIEERVLCHAMGVDYENGEYNVSLQVFKTQSMGSDTPLDVSQSNIQTVNCKGRSIRDAIEGHLNPAIASERAKILIDRLQFIATKA